MIDTGPTGFDPADSDGLRTKGVGCALARKLAARAGLDRRPPERAAARVRLPRPRHAPRRHLPAALPARRASVFWVLGNAERRCPGTVYIADPGVTVRYWVQGISCGPRPIRAGALRSLPAGLEDRPGPVHRGPARVRRSHGRTPGSGIALSERPVVLVHAGVCDVAHVGRLRAAGRDPPRAARLRADPAAARGQLLPRRRPRGRARRRAAALVGASFGGSVCLEVAAARPEPRQRAGAARRPAPTAPGPTRSCATGAEEDGLLEQGDLRGAAILNADFWLTSPEARGPRDRDAGARASSSRRSPRPRRYGRRRSTWGHHRALPGRRRGARQARLPRDRRALAREIPCARVSRAPATCAERSGDRAL